MQTSVFGPQRKMGGEDVIAPPPYKNALESLGLIYVARLIARCDIHRSHKQNFLQL
jgi:hypothetical protein